MLWNEIVAGLNYEITSMKVFWEKPLNEMKNNSMPISGGYIKCIQTGTLRNWVLFV